MTPPRDFIQKINAGSAARVLAAGGAVAGALLAAAGLLAFAGWQFDIAALRDILPGWHPTNPAGTSLAFSLAGISLLAQFFPHPAARRLGVACGIGIVVVAAAELARFAGVDIALFRYIQDAAIAGTAQEAKMAANTAFAFLLTGAALSMIDLEWGRLRVRPSQILALFVSLVALLTIFGDGYGLIAMTGVNSAPMALMAANLFLLTSAGVLCIRPEQGLMGVMSRDTLSGRRARHLVLSAILLPAATGIFVGLLQHLRILSHDTALPVFALVNIIIFAVIAWRNASVLVTKEERYELAVKGSNDGIWDWDVRANNLFWSDRFREILGITDPLFQPSYASFRDRIHPDDRDYILAKLEDHTKNRTPYDAEFRMRHENGTYIWVRARGLSLWDAQGVATRMTGSVTDITSHKLIEQDLRVAKEQADAANRTKSDFLSRMSHELRTPLNSILGLNRLLYEDSKIGAEYRDMARIAYRSADHLLVLVNDMLDLTRVESGELRLDNIVFSLPDVVTSVAESMAPLATDRGLQFSCQFSSAGLPMLTGDPTRLGRVMINLIGNAIKYTERGSVTVEVDCQADDDGMIMVRCDVVDTGIGIPDDQQDAIFSPFAQADTSVTRRFGGTGLGLSISRQIIEKMDGRMGVSSAEGIGSRFWFIVSFAPAGSEIARKGKMQPQRNVVRLPPAERQDVRGSRILVAEDNALNQAFIKKLLSRMGMENVQIVDNGKAAVDAVRENTYSLVLMDCHMPVMSGFDAAAKIRELEKAANLPRLPVIAVTADALEGTRERCISAGMDDYITKPIDAGQLRDIMGRWLTFADEAPPADTKKQASGNVRRILDVLKDYSDNDEELQGLIEAFVTGSDEVMAMLRENCGDGDSREWSEAAHRLKGSAAMLQAEELRALAEQAERMRTASAAERAAIMERLQSALNAVTAELYL